MNSISVFVSSYPLLYGIILYTAVAFLVSFIGGWWTLRKFYQADTAFDGKKIGTVCATMRFGVGYQSCIKIGITKNGMFLSMLLFFRLFHPTLFIPWSDIAISDKKGLFFKYKRINFIKCPHIPFDVSKKLSNKIIYIREHL